MKHSLKQILLQSNEDIKVPDNFASTTMVQIRLIHARKQLYNFIFQTAKVVLSTIFLFAVLAFHISALFSDANSMMLSLIAQEPQMLLSSIGVKAVVDIFPFISFFIMLSSVYFVYRFTKQFAKLEIIPLNSPLYEVF